MDGFSRSLTVAAVIAAVGAVVAFTLVRPHDRGEPAEERRASKVAA
jgi:hypothetical protein